MHFKDVFHLFVLTNQPATSKEGRCSVQYLYARVQTSTGSPCGVAIRIRPAGLSCRCCAGRGGWPLFAKTRASSFAAFGAWATRARLRPSGTRSRRTVGSGVYTRTQQSTTGLLPPPVSTADDTRRERCRKASGVRSQSRPDTVYSIIILAIPIPILSGSCYAAP